LFLGKKFCLYYIGKEKYDRISKIIEEIEEFYNSFELINKQAHDSNDLFYKKFKTYISDNENRKKLKNMKTLILRLEEIFEH